MIVNVSSLAGRKTLPLFSAHHATKYAVEGLTEALQYEREGYGVRVKLVEPGGSKTNFDSSTSMIPGYRLFPSRLSRVLSGGCKVVFT